MRENKLINYYCPFCGVKLLEYAKHSKAFFKTKCANRHCGEIVPVRLDGKEDKEKK